MTMQETVAEMEAQLAQLRRVRAQGTRVVEFSAGNGVTRRVEYRTDKDLAAAINDIERRLGIQRDTRISQVRIQSTKGVC